MFLLSCVVLLSFLGFLEADPDPDCFRQRPQITPMDCCTLPDLLDSNTLQECREEFNANSVEADSPPPPPPPPADGAPLGRRAPPPQHRGHRGHHRCWHCYTCSYECVFNATGLMVDGELNAEKALEHFVEVVTASDPNWTKEIVEDAFTACNDKVKIMREKFSKRSARKPPQTEDGTECSPIPQHLMRCINGELYKTCPSGVRVDSEECSELQDYLNRCHGPLEWKKAQRTRNE